MPGSEKTLSETILSVLQGVDAEGLKVKKCRKLVLKALQEDEEDKQAKKKFKAAVQSLEREGVVELNESHIFLKKERKKKRSVEQVEVDESPSKRVKEDPGDRPSPSTPQNKKLPCKGNPSAITRLFVGNLPFSVDETSLNDFLEKGMTHVKWITDQETGRFYGSAFVEMNSCESAATAVAKTGQELMGRPIKVNYAPARPGDIWPPKSGQHQGAQAGGKGIKALGAKPDGCYKLFIGNLSYEIDDEAITKFFGALDIEIKAVRWIHHRNGDFKGVGFVEFWNTEACEKAASLNGKNLLGRPIRIDWAE